MDVTLPSHASGCCQAVRFPILNNVRISFVNAKHWVLKTPEPTIAQVPSVFPLLPYPSDIFPLCHHRWCHKHFASVFRCLQESLDLSSSWHYLAQSRNVLGPGLLSQKNVKYSSFSQLISFCLCSPGALDRSGPPLPPR